MRMLLVTVGLCAGMIGQGLWRSTQAEETSSLPPFSEVYDLVRTNLAGISSADLNRAAVLGLVNQLQSQLMLVTNKVTEESLAVPLVSKSTILEDAYALIRIGRVGSGLAAAVSNAYESLRATNTLKGIIVDLRFGIGQDYAAAAETADLFFKTEQDLLKWGEKTGRSSAKTGAIDLPMVVLINGYTSGAAEALAATLRQAEGAVLIGNDTAGRAYLFKEYPLSTGVTLRIATGTVTVGKDQRLSEKGVAPDIHVVVGLDEEKAYFEDPFKVVPKSLARSNKPGINDLSAVQNTNRPRRRLNEAELVRMQRDGIDFEAESPPATTAAPIIVPVISDPALSRGIDLLKGLALALKRR